MGSMGKNTWAVPRLPRDQIERKSILKILDNMSQLPRLGDHDHWLATQEQTVKVVLEKSIRQHIRATFPVGISKVISSVYPWRPFHRG